MQLTANSMETHLQGLSSIAGAYVAGDPEKKGLEEEDLTWTLQCDDEFMVTAFTLPAPEPTWGYVVTEAAR